MSVVSNTISPDESRWIDFQSPLQSAVFVRFTTSENERTREDVVCVLLACDETGCPTTKSVIRRKYIHGKIFIGFPLQGNAAVAGDEGGGQFDVRVDGGGVFEAAQEEAGGAAAEVFKGLRDGRKADAVGQIVNDVIKADH